VRGAAIPGNFCLRSGKRKLPLGLRDILSRYLPDYAYSVGALNTFMPFQGFRDLARSQDKAILADADPPYSTR
jgi:hypothetical protein